MSDRKETYILFEEGKTPRIYVNPTDRVALLEKGKLIKKPMHKKINSIPLEYWKLDGDQVVASKGKAAKEVVVEVERIRENHLEAEIMERKERIKKLESQFLEMQESVDAILSSAREEEEKLKAVEKQLKSKSKRISALIALSLVEAAAIIVAYLPQVKRLFEEIGK